MDKRPVLFHRIHEWDYNQFMVGCLVELDALRDREIELEQMSDKEFEDRLKSFNVRPLRRRIDDLTKVSSQRAQILYRDIEITPIEYAEIKKQADADVDKFREVAFGGLKAIQLAKELGDNGFWVDKNAKKHKMSALPISADFEPILAIDLDQIQDINQLRANVTVAIRPFKEFEVVDKNLRDQALFSQNKSNLNKLIEIAGHLAAMNKAGVVSAIS